MMKGFYIAYCAEHNPGGGARLWCDGCRRERDCERDNGYARGWQDARDTAVRAMAVCALFWELHVFYERGGVR